MNEGTSLDMGRRKCRISPFIVNGINIITEKLIIVPLPEWKDMPKQMEIVV